MWSQANAELARKHSLCSAFFTTRIALDLEGLSSALIGFVIMWVNDPGKAV